MSAGPPTVRTVTGEVAAADLGLVLPHEHLFNDLTAVLSPPRHAHTRRLAEREVSADVAWALRQDPYCCADNLAPKPVDDVLGEVAVFREVGGGTVVDATSSPAIGRDPERLREVARRGGINVVMGSGCYLEKSEGDRLSGGTVERLARSIEDEFAHGVGESGVRPGLIGEIGVSPDFTDAERASLRAAALAELNQPDVPLMVHLPGWQRRGHEVLDLVLDEIGVEPGRVVLAHMDPSSADGAYQDSLADRGVWLEFDMVGMDITFPGEGEAPPPERAAAAVARLVSRGNGAQLLLSHDMFLKQMWTQNGGNGLAFVPTVFAGMLADRGVDPAAVSDLLRRNPARMLAGRPAT